MERTVINFGAGVVAAGLAGVVLTREFLSVCTQHSLRWFYFRLPPSPVVSQSSGLLLCADAGANTMFVSTTAHAKRLAFSLPVENANVVQYMKRSPIVPSATYAF